MRHEIESKLKSDMFYGPVVDTGFDLGREVREVSHAPFKIMQDLFLLLQQLNTYTHSEHTHTHTHKHTHTHTHTHFYLYEIADFTCIVSYAVACHFHHFVNSSNCTFTTLQQISQSMPILAHLLLTNV